MNLAEAQHAFLDVIRGSAPKDDEVTLWSGGLHGTARRRLDLYRGMYRARLVEALRDGFPKLAGALGTRFGALALSYLERCPSRQPVIERVGEALPGFLETSGDESLRALAPLARLECARTQAFLAPDPPRHASPSEIDPERLDVATVRFVPSFLLLWLPARSVRQWGECELDLPDDAHACTVVSRRGTRVGHRTLPAHEGQALEALMTGDSVGDAFEAFANCSEPVVMASIALARWFAAEWLEDVRYPAALPENHP